MLGDDDFLADSVLVRTVTTASEFLGSVSDGVSGCSRADVFADGFGGFSALAFFLRGAKGMKAGNGCGVFLPSQVPALEVFVEFGFLGFEKREFPDVGEGDDSVGEDLAVVLERTPEFEDFANGFQPTLASHQHPGGAFPAQNRRVEELTVFDGVLEFLQSFRIEFLTLAFGLDDDFVKANGVHESFSYGFQAG